MVQHQDTIDDGGERVRGIWLRGLLMLVFAFFFGIAETILFVSAVVQFFCMLFTKKPNQKIAEFGESLGK